MKKLFTLIAGLSCTFAVAQSSIQMTNLDLGTNISNGGIVYVGASPGATVSTQINIKNTSSNTCAYTVTRTKLLMNSGASTQFCFAGHCYGPGTSVSTCTLTAGQDAQTNAGGPLLVDFSDGPSSGMSDVQYRFVNNSNPNDTAVVTIKYNNPLGVASNQNLFNTIGEIFPNPVKESASVVLNTSAEQEITVTVYNALGTAVSVNKVYLSAGRNNVAIATEGLPSGIYFATLVNGKTKLTKKFIVNR
ncbi:MAG: T9SS type A sorting domain-containing protein [Bacteroidetes bacterium]|nr:T9SS type A sorting domain-containing protein [Bacteroidota bacterium]